MLGISCPFCGMTRACALVIHGHFTEALRMNALIVILPIVGVHLVKSDRILEKEDILSENGLTKSNVNK